MNADDEQLLRGGVYGQDHDGPSPSPGPLPHQTYAALVGGPLDVASFTFSNSVCRWGSAAVEDERARRCSGEMTALASVRAFVRAAEATSASDRSGPVASGHV